MSEPAKPYRPCVAMALFNGDGRVLVAERNDMDWPCWQLPQGGIDDGESPVTAAFRELREEIGTDAATVLAETEGWIAYDWPTGLKRTPGKGRYGGQKVKAVALRFTGTDADIDLATEHPEFRAWRWTELESIPALIVDFKKPLYEAAVRAFLPVRDRLRDT